MLSKWKRAKGSLVAKKNYPLARIAYLCAMLRGADQTNWLAEIIPIEPEPGNAGVGKETIRERLRPRTDPWGPGASYLIF
jgi:hypothetical protein